MDAKAALDRVTEMERVAAASKRQAEMMADFLDDALARQDTLFVEAAQMGETPSYIASVSLEWIRRQVNLAHTMPLLKKKMDPATGKVRIDEESIEIIRQRPIDWSREAVLAKYLIEREHHKFPPILAVLSEPWVDDPNSEMWDDDGRAKETSTIFHPLDGRGRVGLIDLSSETRLYALDGQHRVIGISAALNLISTGRLDVREKEGQVKRDEMLLLDDLIAEFDLDEAKVQKLGSERMGIEIIPAVIEGESREEAQLRVRTTFTHVNKQAAPLTPGEISQLDEDNGFAIVARRVAVRHSFFKDVKNAVNFKNSTISKRSAHITTLQTLTEMARSYLIADNRYTAWAPKRFELPRRPQESELNSGIEEFTALWDHIVHLPTFHAIASGEPAALHRRFAHEDAKEGKGFGHMLLRPVGQQALAQAVGLLRADGMSLEEIFAKLSELDRRNGFQLDSVANPWWGILYDFNGQRISIRGRETAVKILRHMVAGLPDRDRRELREAIAEARFIGGDEYRDYTDTRVSKSKINLPELI
ncbi:DGQHR domain-containing protein [Streptomyces sp. NPDC088812]|uniref:DGQHR domain-containing protein n=1 Tax=Streptomyces sp. NPDC088812 TaxID=3365905 RepID=UPI00382B6E59